MTTPTRAERDEMRALLAKATPGPWEFLGSNAIHDGLVITQHPDHKPGPFDEANDQICDMLGNEDRGGPNGHLMTALRNRAEALLDELDRAEAENNITRDNMRSVWAALGRVREAVEAICLPGAVPQAHEVDGFPEPVAEAMTLSSAIAARVETAEATIARLTAEVTEEEVDRVAVYKNDLWTGYDFVDPVPTITALLASRKGGGQ